jgi:hypothetical protein
VRTPQSWSDTNNSPRAVAITLSGRLKPAPTWRMADKSMFMGADLSRAVAHASGQEAHFFPIEESYFRKRDLLLQSRQLPYRVFPLDLTAFCFDAFH